MLLHLVDPLLFWARARHSYNVMHSGDQLSSLTSSLYLVAWVAIVSKCYARWALGLWCCAAHADVYICMQGCSTGSAAYQARASPIKHAALHSPAPVGVREVYPSHTHGKGPTLPLAVSFTIAEYHRTINVTRSGTTTSRKCQSNLVNKREVQSNTCYFL